MDNQQWREWNLEGLEVTQLCFDFQFRVQMWSSERSLLITFGSPVVLRSNTGEPLLLDPEQTHTLSPLVIAVVPACCVIPRLVRRTLPTPLPERL